MTKKIQTTETTLRFIWDTSKTLPRSMLLNDSRSGTTLAVTAASCITRRTT